MWGGTGVQEQAGRSRQAGAGRSRQAVGFSRQVRHCLGFTVWVPSCVPEPPISLHSTHQPVPASQ